MKKSITFLLTLCFMLSLCSCGSNVDLSGIESKIDDIQKELQEKDLANVIIKNDEPISVDIEKEKYDTVFLTTENIDKYIAINASVQDVEVIRYEYKNSSGFVEILFDLYMVIEVETSSNIPNCIFEVGFTSFSFKIYSDEPNWEVSNYSFSTIDSNGNSSCSFILYNKKSRYGDFLDISPDRVRIDYPIGYVKIPVSQQ